MLALHICCLTTLVGCVVIAIGELDITNFDKNEDLAHNHLSQRIKRNNAGIQTGKAALKYLLNGADHLTSFGDSGMYLKRGGYRAALRDFKAVHPTQVEVVHDIHGVIRTSGMVGNKRIIIEKGKGTRSTSLKITKNCCEFQKKQSKLDYNVIIYKDS